MKVLKRLGKDEECSCRVKFLRAKKIDYRIQVSNRGRGQLCGLNPKNIHGWTSTTFHCGFFASSNVLVGEKKFFPDAKQIKMLNEHRGLSEKNASSLRKRKLETVSFFETLTQDS